MKIYILNYKLNKLNNFLSIFAKTNINIKEIIEIYSNEGNMIIDKENTYKLNYFDKNLIKINNYFNNYDFIIDNSITIREEISQLPSKHLAIHKNIYSFKLNQQSKIKLLIITINNEIDDFYFEITEEIDINNVFIKEEFNEFLSMFN
jgi:hypothetical protein